MPIEYDGLLCLCPAGLEAKLTCVGCGRVMCWGCVGYWSEHDDGHQQWSDTFLCVDCENIYFLGCEDDEI